jgi:hypothetical protein
MRAADLLTALVLMAAGGVVIADALRLGVTWGSDGPESGFFPFWLAVLMVVCAASIALQAAWRATTAPFATAAQLRPVVAVLAPAVAMVLVTEWLGLYVAAVLYLAFYMRWVGRHSWPLVVAIALGVPLLTFVVFEQWFLVPMPKGPIEAWLGF